MINKFSWHEYNINDKLPGNWVTQIKTVSAKYLRSIFITPKSVTSREIDRNLKIETLVVDGNVIKHKLPWLYELYLGPFKDLGQQCISEQLFTAKNPLYAINLNVQRGTKMRYECHVDSNPLQGLLYVTSQPKGSGGELIVSNNEESVGEIEIEKNSEKIYPVSGRLIFFDARRNPHFVKPLVNDNDERIAIAMNFYTPSSSEDQRPGDLNAHLFNENE